MAQMVKKLSAVRDLCSISRSGRSPGERNGNPLCVPAWRIPWTEETLCPWGCKESDTTERLTHTHMLSNGRLRARDTLQNCPHS